MGSLEDRRKDAEGIMSRLRNVGVVAHIDAGKTTVSERMLFQSGVERRFGEVDSGTTVLDWMAEERERGITITAAATTMPWRGHAVNLIDTPGHVDFTVEVERSLRVLDGAVLVVDAVAGVQAQSETVWRQMRAHSVPAVVFVNKCDRQGAAYLTAIDSVRRRLGVRAVPVQYPLYEKGSGAGEGLLWGLVDLVSGETWDFRGDATKFRSVHGPVPEEVADEVGVLRAELLEVLAEDDEAVLECLVEGREPEVALLRRVLRTRTCSGSLLPCLCGAALRNVGIPPLLDAIVDLLPSPLEVARQRGVDPRDGSVVVPEPDPAAPLVALVFKVWAAEHGDLTYVRLYSGTLEPAEKAWVPRLQAYERISRVMRMHADHGESLERAVPGDIVALTGIKNASTGDTLCTRDAPVVLERSTWPDPVITRSVEPASSSDRDKLRAALHRLEREDPSFRVREDEDTGELLMLGMGELHLEVIEHRLQRDFHVETRVGQPRVAYRESLRTGARGEARVENTIGGRDVFGAVAVELAPNPVGTENRLEWASEVIPRAFRPVVEEALLLEAQIGPRFGFPMVSTLVRVVGGASDPRRDAEIAFAQAATAAMREAGQQAGIDVLEPMMRFEITTPAEFASGILADLSSRRATVEDVRAEADQRLLRGQVALSQMFGYASAIRSLSQGRAGFTLVFAGHAPVPEAELRARGLVWS